MRHSGASNFNTNTDRNKWLTAAKRTLNVRRKTTHGLRTGTLSHTDKVKMFSGGKQAEIETAELCVAVTENAHKHREKHTNSTPRYCSSCRPTSWCVSRWGSLRVLPFVPEIWEETEEEEGQTQTHTHRKTAGCKQSASWRSDVTRNVRDDARWPIF